MFRERVHIPLDVLANDLGGTNHLLNDAHKDFTNAL